MYEGAHTPQRVAMLLILALLWFALSCYPVAARPSIRDGVYAQPGLTRARICVDWPGPFWVDRDDEAHSGLIGVGYVSAGPACIDDHDYSTAASYVVTLYAPVRGELRIVGHRVLRQRLTWLPLVVR